jgi:hypothetical protein
MYTVTAVIPRDAQTRARHIFFDQFDQMYRKARLQQVWSKLHRHNYQLQDLGQAKQKETVQSSQTAGVQLIPIDRIQGSEGRTQDFDAEFRPLNKHTRERWLNVATARYMGKSLPPISLVRLGCSYFVRDGHHRISVAKAMGQYEIEAEVTLWNAESEALCSANSPN